MRKAISNRIRIRIARVADDMEHILRVYAEHMQPYDERLLRFAIADLKLLSVRLDLTEHEMLPWEPSLPPPN